MSLSLRITLLIFSLLLIVITTMVLKKGRIPVKYSLLWYFSAIIILLLSIFPFVIRWVADLFGFEAISSMVTGILITILLFLTMSLTIITSGQRHKIALLIQEISLLKERVEKLENKKK